MPPSSVTVSSVLPSAVIVTVPLLPESEVVTFVLFCDIEVEDIDTKLKFPLPSVWITCPLLPSDEGNKSPLMSTLPVPLPYN